MVQIIENAVTLIFVNHNALQYIIKIFLHKSFKYEDFRVTIVYKFCSVSSNVNEMFKKISINYIN